MGPRPSSLKGIMYNNCVKNHHLDLVAKKAIIPASAFATGQITGASTVLTSGFGSGTPNIVELGTSNMAAVRLAATTDELDWTWIPSDFDNRHPLYIRYLWTSDYGTANGTATFTTLWSALATGSAAAIGATALTKTHGASTKVAATARALYWSNYGIIAPLATGTFANHTLPVDTIALNFNVKASAVSGLTIGSDFVYICAVELSYTPRLTFGSSNRPARLLVDGLSANLELDVTNDV